MFKCCSKFFTVVAAFLVCPLTLSATDWTGFRGSDHSGVSEDRTVPLEWSNTKNLKWSAPLPGKGASSPIVLGDRIYLTTFSGYAQDRSDPGSPSDLKRHLVAIDRTNGKIVWDTAVDAVLPEDRYQGYMTEHGYASPTPVTDGERIYAFFGKSGLVAFDMEGKKLWQKDCGQESNDRHWGSGGSPILYKDKVIVNASDESESIRAFNKVTGEELWKAQAAGLALTFNTPRIVETPDGEDELVVAVPYEVWGLNPETGKLTWFAECNLDGNVSPTIAYRDGIVYAVGGRGGGAVAVKTGGKDNVTESHVVWSSRETTYVPSPVLFEDYLYWVSDRGQAFCLEAKSGKSVYRERLPSPSNDSGNRPGGGRSGGGGNGFYASAVVVGDRIYAVNRKGVTYVLATGPEFKILATNVLEGDGSDFNGSPAISDGEIFLRSDKKLYCIGQ